MKPPLLPAVQVVRASDRDPSRVFSGHIKVAGGKAGCIDQEKTLVTSSEEQSAFQSKNPPSVSFHHKKT